MKLKFKPFTPYAYTYLTKVLTVYGEDYHRSDRRKLKEVLYVIRFNCINFKHRRKLDRLVKDICLALDDVRDEVVLTQKVMDVLVDDLLKFYYTEDLVKFRRVGKLMVYNRKPRLYLSEEGLSILYRAKRTLSADEIPMKKTKRKEAVSYVQRYN